MTEQQLSLEQIIGQVFGQAQASSAVETSLKKYSRNPTDGKAVMEYLNFAQIPPEMKKDFAARLVKKSPLEIADLMRSTRANYDNGIAQALGGNLQTVLASNDGSLLASLAYGISGSYTAIEELKDNLEKRDMAQAKKTFVEMTPFGQYKDWVTFITKIADDQDIAALSVKFMETQKDYFIRQFLSERGEGDKKEAYIDVAKVKEYITQRLGQLDEKQIPLALAYAGKSAYASYAEARAAQEKAEKAKSKPKA